MRSATWLLSKDLISGYQKALSEARYMDTLRGSTSAGPHRDDLTVFIDNFDAKRFGWSDVPMLVKVLGFLGYLPSIGFAFWAMLENAYASNVVRIQEDRGHEVCTTGPYRFMRHPMYVGVIFGVIFIPISLGSYYALILSASAIILFITRTALEDKTLQEELPGYKEYAQKVRYRLFPGLW